MICANRVITRGKFRCSLFGFAAVLVFVFAAVGWAAESDPAPSPLYQQSLQGSIQKFQEGDRGGGSPQTLQQAQPVGAISAGNAVGLQAVEANLPSPTPLSGLAKPAAYCLLQREATNASFIFPGFLPGDRVAVYYDPANGTYGCSPTPYPFEIKSIRVTLTDAGFYVGV